MMPNLGFATLVPCPSQGLGYYIPWVNVDPDTLSHGHAHAHNTVLVFAEQLHRAGLPVKAWLDGGMLRFCADLRLPDGGGLAFHMVCDPEKVRQYRKGEVWETLKGRAYLESKNRV